MTTVADHINDLEVSRQQLARDIATAETSIKMLPKWRSDVQRIAKAIDALKEAHAEIPAPMQFHEVPE